LLAGTGSAGGRAILVLGDPQRPLGTQLMDDALSQVVDSWHRVRPKFLLLGNRVPARLAENEDYELPV
jgi:hypothetical protein